MKWSQVYFLSLQMFNAISFIVDYPDKIGVYVLAAIMLIALGFALYNEGEDK